MLPPSSEIALEVGLGWIATCSPLAAVAGASRVPLVAAEAAAAAAAALSRLTTVTTASWSAGVDPVDGRDVGGDVPGAERSR